MLGPTWLDFARLVCAAYDTDSYVVPGGWTRIWFGAIGTGFQGARYRRAQFGVVQEVVAFTGTDSLEDGIADVGFAGGSTLSTVLSALSPSLGVVLSAGRSGLNAQLSYASELLMQARWSTSQTGGSLYVCGHSLGGGLAQLVTADQGGQAVTVSAPTVSQMPGALTRYARTNPTIVNLRVDRDPINGTEALGNRLGSTVRLATNRGIAAAHSSVGTVADLGPEGSCTDLGMRRPL